ncbi:ABC-type transport auxiliary lipoprotein family protein [Methylococcus sp. ANG]|uniref:ABC-type transport auxiliary lipoprotein family protein n=1 Tax=unclassified Methylococcus TaxID=2618889 RepID=UPI001C5293FE|nr:ABC-type transport auxiliary lipoprotein family protein [Methylococcus sp. Mc7]QXP83258.1 membrane integrity-associated transporter subunit PqiC [Methylococcus sp. Mc7]
MTKIAIVRWCRRFAAGSALVASCACSLLFPAATPHPAFYSLDSARGIEPTESLAAAAPTLTVSPPLAAAGFDSTRIIYVREAHKLEYFAHSEWVDPPARMLAPLLVAALERSGAFRAVILTPSAAGSDLRLDTEIIRLQHEFGTQPSRVRFTLRAYLIDDKTRRVLARREFEAVVPASSEDPYGGVVAANQTVQTVLQDLSAFCAEAALRAGMKR